MAPNPKVAKACKAMKDMGISQETGKAVLKRLLKLYDNKWNLIEDENYRVLLDSVFEYEEAKRVELKKKEFSLLDESEEEYEPPLKRNCSESTHVSHGHRSTDPNLNSSSEDHKDKGKKLISPHNVPLETSWPEKVSENHVDLVAEGVVLPPEKDVVINNHAEALNKIKDENLFENLAEFEVPLAVILPDGTSRGNDVNATAEGKDKDDGGDNNDNATDLSQLDIASSPMGEVKISLTFNSCQPSDFHIPSLDAVFKAVDEKFLKSYRLKEPNFSVMTLMKEFCECFWAMGTTKPSNENDERKLITLKPNLDRPITLNALDHPQANFPTSLISFNGSLKLNNLYTLVPQIQREISLNGFSCLMYSANSTGYQATKSLHIYVDDITKGEEQVKISLINEINTEQPPNFYYIPKNIIFQKAYVNFALARISDEDCCFHCFGDCVSLPVPCACARESGGEFAYTVEGLVKEKFMEEYISMNREPVKNRLFYCKECPLERSKNGDVPDPCKGHFIRKFIKECWCKCGCNKQCGNRVVQRGITAKLQVFFTPQGKGWGLRTLDDLPKGAFICEYVGEILTNTELYERNMKSSGNEKHTYPVLLDADWGSEGVLKDEEALCLDGTIYGNVARFINHRCFDANLVEIPVEVETPDHHYYHLAYFTTRKIDAMEELTWDYGIDFDDDYHPVKAFQCSCGSLACRDLKSSRRTNAGHDV